MSNRATMLALAAALACAFPALAQPAEKPSTEIPEPPRARVESGEVIGVAHDGVASFKGIPYAAPPVGELRWRAPQRPQPWRVARSAEDYGHSCSQRSPPERVVPSSAAAVTGEDCLTLNVWTPVQHAKQSLPVMVWIHGGGNAGGTSAQTYYDGSSFARDGVVMVSLNYRLGVFGFFAHSALTHDGRHGARANFGLLDQLAALHWVKRNIAAFGGDPGNVTVFGESAGGADILLLMTARTAAGSFQKAIVESAGWWTYTPDLSEAKQIGATIATSLGLPGEAATAAQLRAVSADALAALHGVDELGPAVDHDFLTESAVAAFEHGRAMDIPLIIGTNNNEGSVLSSDAKPADTVPDLSESDLATLKSLYGPHGAAGPQASNGPQDTDDAALASLLFRDAHFAMPSRWVAAHEAAGAPVFLYRFDYVASFLSHRRSGANHGSEIPFVFATWPEYRLTEADQQVTRLMHGCWVAFAKTGTPTCPGAPAWPAYSAESDLWMRFETHATVEPAADRQILDLLQSRLLH